MTATVKRGDSAPLTLTLGVDLSVYSGATVVLQRIGSSATPTSITGAIVGQTVTCTLTSTHTAVVGSYRVEVEMTPGPHTYPSSGYSVLNVVADLNP